MIGGGMMVVFQDEFPGRGSLVGAIYKEVS